MSAFFDERHETYDVVHTGHIGGGIESKRQIASLLPAGAQTLLDLGVGTGLELEAIFERFPEIRVTGLDISPRMLDMLHQKYPNRHVETVLQSYLTHEYPESAYDAVVTVMTLHHYRYSVKLELYKKILSSLKPGGVYIECDYILADTGDEAPEAVETRLFAEYDRLRAAEGIDDEREYHFDTPLTRSHQLSLYREAGFTGIREVFNRENTLTFTMVKPA